MRLEEEGSGAIYSSDIFLRTCDLNQFAFMLSWGLFSDTTVRILHESV